MTYKVKSVECAQCYTRQQSEDGNIPSDWTVITVFRKFSICPNCFPDMAKQFKWMTYGREYIPTKEKTLN